MPFLIDVEMFVDIPSQAEQEQKKARVDEQQSLISVTRSSGSSHVCTDELESSVLF